MTDQGAQGKRQDELIGVAEAAAVLALSKRAVQVIITRVELPAERDAHAGKGDVPRSWWDRVFVSR